MTKLKRLLTTTLTLLILTTHAIAGGPAASTNTQDYWFTGEWRAYSTNSLGGGDLIITDHTMVYKHGLAPDVFKVIKVMHQKAFLIVEANADGQGPYYDYGLLSLDDPGNDGTGMLIVYWCGNAKAPEPSAELFQKSEEELQKLVPIETFCKKSPEDTEYTDYGTFYVYVNG